MPDPGAEVSLGTVAGLTVWPVKSMGGGATPAVVPADVTGLAGDRRYALRDLRSDRPDQPLSARRAPGLLRWSASPGPDEPLVTGPDGRQWSWSSPGLPEALSQDLGVEAQLMRKPSGCQDLADSVLVTTVNSHRAVEVLFRSRLEPARWRTNMHLDLPDSEPFAEHGWQGRRLVVGGPGGAVLRLLHPCRRCSIPTYGPGGLHRTPELLHWITNDHAGPFGINARVEVPGTLQRGAPVSLD